MPLKDVFSKLKTAVVGTSTSKIDTKLDQAVKSIVSYKSQSGRNGYIELVRSLISKSAEVKVGGSSSLFTQGATPTAFGQGGRLLRYRTYEAIVSNINYCRRALDVLVDNVLSPDDITKISLEVRPTTYLEDEAAQSESKSKVVKQFIEELGLEERLNIIVRNTLEYGDLFCEIADPKTALTSRSILSESNYIGLMKRDEVAGNREVLTHRVKKEKYQIIMDFSSFNEPESSSKEKPVKLKDIRLLFHEPKFVIRLQSSLFPLCFGYLIFPQITLYPGVALQDEPINNICLSILKSLEKKIPQMKEFNGVNDLKDILRTMLSQTDVNRMMNIRYVPPDRMVHFMVPSTRYYPYGESIFDGGQYSAKVLIALETALAIQRLSRSTEKRKISIEVGLPRDAKKAVEAMKEEFRKRKVSLDSFGTVDTIPSMITTFEDVYIPTKDGKAFVDVSTFNEGNVDIRSKVDELKFMRDQLTASLGVPPSFINIEENLSNKAALAEENILFARTIVGHQKYLTHQVVELVQKVFDIVKPDESLTILDDVNVAFPVPRSLQFEREARYMGELASLVETLERVGIPREYSKKRYLSQIDWQEVKKYEIDSKIQTELDPSKKKEEEGMGGMGGMGGVGTF